MKIKAAIVCTMVMLFCAAPAFAADPKLDGAYKLVSLKFPGGESTEANLKGLIVVHGRYLAFVRASADRKAWTEQESKEEQMMKKVAAYEGLAATAGMFEIQGNIISLTQMTQSNPASVGKVAKFEYKLDGDRLTIKFPGNADVAFTFERLP
ncbi:MAG TPA: lipocalin-like domain-containing protein [Blastocatellia bacterium]|nr:lipocalin-like domain-containing protein [Blastocatellia bacterium]